MEFHNSWQKVFDQEIQKPYMQALNKILAKEYKTKNIYPAKENIFAALKNTAPEDVKVVILGQDPYHGPGQAHGLAFSVNPDCPIPPSLKNMYKELEQEYHCKLRRSGDLHDWAQDGVLLLNPILTVEESHPLSHKDLGWQLFTNEILKYLNQLDQPIVFLLWGSKAREAKKLLSNPSHLILESSHPSPLSAHRGFFGNNHFLKANTYLQQHGKSPVRWCHDNLND